MHYGVGGSMAKIINAEVRQRQTYSMHKKFREKNTRIQRAKESCEQTEIIVL